MGEAAEGSEGHRDDAAARRRRGAGGAAGQHAGDGACSSPTSASPTRRASPMSPRPPATASRSRACSSSRMASGSSRRSASIRARRRRFAAKKEGASRRSTRSRVTSDGYSLRFSLEPFVEPSTRAGRRYARVAKAPRLSASRGHRRRDPDRRDAPGARHAVQGRRGQLPGGSRPRRDPDQAAERRTIGSLASSPRPATATC